MSNSKMSSWNHSKLSSWSPVGAIGSIALFFALVFLAACTDYVDQMEGDFEDWKAEQARESSDSAQTSRSDLQSSSSREELSSSSNQFNPDIKYGELLDSRDGQTYRTVKIGSQTWMAENLNYKTVDSYCYNDNESNCTKYGRLYTWNAAKTACPSGWHLPTETEWNTLFTAVGGQSTAGKMLKSTSGWNGSGNGTDAYAFSALPAGYRNNDGRFNYEGNYGAYFWSSTEGNSSHAYNVYLGYNYGYADLGNHYKIYGYSVRCLKDEGEAVESSSSVTLQSSSSSTSVSSSSITKIDGSEYDAGKNALTDLRDGKTYKTVTIGTQTWMAENLNYKTVDSYCYNDNESNCTKYGRLYTWAAAMDSVGTLSTNGKGCGYGTICSPTYPVRGICPEGWHLPTEEEFETLFTAVGGKSTAGRMLKSTSGWNSSGNGTDAYAFSALPAGFRNYYGNFNYEGYYAYFWSSAEYSSGDAYYMDLNYTNDNANLGSNDKYYGFSVRCLKDEGEVVESSSSVTPKSSSSATSVSSSSEKSSSSVASSSSEVPELAEGTLTDARDGKTYKTVTIGTQTWMAQNLNYETASSYCYSANASNCVKYGRLYTWTAASDACPTGWHLPSKVEFETLFTAVGGQSTAGGMLKSASGWNGSDAYLFSALPAGSRSNTGIGYGSEGDYAYFWSSTKDGSFYAYSMYLRIDSERAFLSVEDNYGGYSVRCVKN